MRVRADWHIHSCLSPCGGLDMAPSAIVRVAAERGLTALALTDHNSARNCPAFAVHCERYGLHALFGMEVNTLEEVHVLCLFDRLDVAMALDRMIEACLPKIPNQPERFGDQVVVDEDDRIIGMVEHWLISAAGIGVGALLEWVHGAGGLCIPSHVDRMSNGLCSQLGFVPDEPFDALEVTGYYDLEHDGLGLCGRYPLLRHSDAHTLEHIGRCWSNLEVAQWNMPALRDALHGARGGMSSA